MEAFRHIQINFERLINLEGQILQAKHVVLQLQN